MKQKQKSFTLVEILTATAIICLLAAVILIAYNGIYRSWATANTVATMKSAHLALDRFALENTRYPTGIDRLGAVADSSEGSPKLAKDLFQECAPYSFMNGSELCIFDDFGTKPAAGNNDSINNMKEIYYIYPYNETNTFVLASKGKNGDWQGDDDIIYLPFGLPGTKPGFYYGNINVSTGLVEGELEPIAQ